MNEELQIKKREFEKLIFDLREELKIQRVMIRKLENGEIEQKSKTERLLSPKSPKLNSNKQLHL